MDDNSVGMDDDEDRWSDDDDDARMDDDTDDDEQTMTPLVQAIVDGEPLDVIQSILRWSPELMQQKVDTRYPLSYAVRYGSPADVVRALYRCWPESVRVKDFIKDSYFPLHHVSDDTPVETVQFLVDAYPEALHHEALHFGLPIHMSVQHGAPIAAVRVLAERCPGTLLVPNQDGLLPIHLAVTEANPSSNFELVEYLADRCPESLRVLPPHGGVFDRVFPIHVAAEIPRPNQLRIIQLLANRCPESVGVATDMEDDFGDTDLLPIHLVALAMGEQQLPIIELLADQFPESLLATTTYGYLPVQMAILSSSGTQAGVIRRLAVEPIPEETRRGLMHFLLRELLERCVTTPDPLLENVSVLADAVPETLRAKDSEGSLPIHFALQPNERIDPATTLSIVRRLVAPDPESLLVENSAGDLPIHTCTHMETAEFLFESCPQAALKAGRDGNFPIHIALAKRWFGLVKSVVGLYPRESQRVGARGRTPMHVAATLQNWSQDEELDAAAALVRSWPESLLIGDAGGNLPIHVAIDALTGDWACEFVRFLIDRSPDSLRAPGAGGRLPLHAAASRAIPSPKLVRLLVDSWNGALVARDASGNAPLRLATANRSAPLDVVYALVRARPDLLRSGLS